METLIDKLKELGFNSYEAKVYLALLKCHPATGYEVSKASGVPQARAYDTLKSLESNRFVVALGGKPATYSPISPAELLDRWERRFKSSVSFLRETLPSFGDQSMDPVTNLQGEKAVFEHVQTLISHSQASLYMELWAEDVPRFEPVIATAIARGVDVRIVGYDGFEIEGALIYDHGHGLEIVKALGGRWVVAAVDDEEGILATVPDPRALAVTDSNRTCTHAHGVYTRNPGLVSMMKMLVVHDIFVLDMESKLHDELVELYGPGLLRLREKILGPNATIGYH